MLCYATLHNIALQIAAYYITAQRATPHRITLHYSTLHTSSHPHYTTPHTSNPHHPTPHHTTTHPFTPHHSINPATRPIRLRRPITAFARIMLSTDIFVDSYLFGCCVTSVVYSYFSVYRYLISPHHPNKGTPVPVTVSQKLR